MVEAEPWFIGLIAGLATLILVLLCLIVIFCTLWARKDRKRKRENRLQQQQERHFANVNVKHDVVGPQSNSMALVPVNNNTNWYLSEKPHDEFRSPPTYTRAAGDEPFLVGNSIVRYSKELDRSSSYNYRPVTAEKYAGYHSSSQWNRPVHTLARLEAPNEAETRMVRLGMIPPRPLSANGNIPSGYYTEPGRGKSSKGKDGKKKIREIEDSRRYHEEERPGMIPPRPVSANGHIPAGYLTEPGRGKSPKGKDGKKKSKELEDSRRHRGEVLVPVREVQLWPIEESSSNHPAPFPLPKEDYNTDGATWYYSRPLDGQSATSSKSAEHLVYPPSPTGNYPGHGSQNVNGRIVTSSLPHNVSPTSPKVMADLFHANDNPDKLKRVQRVGVPILPE
ncbi:uncharacterized protein LOC144632888 [Oculina patagonica]